MTALDQTLAALAEPNRRRILDRYPSDADDRTCNDHSAGSP